MILVNPDIEAYAKKFTSQNDPLLVENENDTMLGNEHAQMHSGHVQGMFLEAVSRMLKPRRILEIGTFTGFSALCLVKGLSPEGILHTIELRQEDADNAGRYFKMQGVADKIVQHTGAALEVIPHLRESWDLVFIDADKVNYIQYYELTLPCLNKGGWILADNVFFHGDVLGENIRGKNAKAMNAFNEHVAADNRVEQLILTVRDGIMLIRKL